MRQRIRSSICCLLSSLFLLGAISPLSIAHAGRREDITFERFTVEETAAGENGRCVSCDIYEAAAQPRRQISWTELRRRFRGTFTTRGPAVPRRVALTFDDVPDTEFTPKVLDILARYHVKATFFIVGQRAKEHPEMVRRIVREGHAIGNHSYNHMVFSNLSQHKFSLQIAKTESILKSIVGFAPRYIRPPYGEITPGQLEWARKHGYYIVNWNVDSEDWRSISSGRVLQNIKRTLTPGSIVLQHAGGGVGEDLSGTVKALPELIGYLRQKGYEIVTLPELLGRSVEVR
ncbi:polysaccharide deacetylase family protein [Paenibacillus beijingensis]|uniref:NodB homology domain-containing protein n=1 Tax=Paenibacillus beijingensis TaxID=1126833 RepID=A0A0D5NK53_9BACL|nr:polysaccharide deacetylase family protein [Paenibacillus beijingensis]AJY75724.1 hypothetical protein VN24_15655 [Paenibacillus beijingensis]